VEARAGGNGDLAARSLGQGGGVDREGFVAADRNDAVVDDIVDADRERAAAGRDRAVIDQAVA
jgi:hypothetical protein